MKKVFVLLTVLTAFSTAQSQATEFLFGKYRQLFFNPEATCRHDCILKAADNCLTYLLIGNQFGDEFMLTISEGAQLMMTQYFYMNGDRDYVLDEKSFRPLFTCKQDLDIFLWEVFRVDIDNPK